MIRHLFVYGTLKRSATTAAMGTAERARLWHESRLLGPAEVAGRLYDFGDYPGLVLDPASADSRVHGEVLLLDDPAATVAWLDAYEMIVPGKDAESEYTRVSTPLLDHWSGGAAADRSVDVDITAWVYVTRRDVRAMTPHPGGRWP